MNPPTALVIATSPETSFWPLTEPLLWQLGRRSLLEEHLAVIAGLGCSRFVVVGSAAMRETVEQLTADLEVSLRFVPMGEGRHSLADGFVAAEAALSHLATGPVLVTQPHFVAEHALYRDLLEAWANRGSGVDGVFAGARRAEAGPGALRLVERDGRLVDCLPAGAPEGGSTLVYGGAMVYASSRELCETVGEEADKRGHEDALARALSRLMAWNDIRGFEYDGTLIRLERAGDLVRLADFVPAAKLDAVVDASSTLRGRVVFGHGCRVEAGARIEDSVLGDACVVRGGAVLRNSLLGTGVDLGEGSNVTRSVLDSACRVEAGARIGVDSSRSVTVVGAGALIGAGAVVLPGVAIGPGEVIEARQVVDSDAGWPPDVGAKSEQQRSSEPAVRPRLHFER
jgi:NDP-sugar pyrophosphorylase family protein